MNEHAKTKKFADMPMLFLEGTLVMKVGGDYTFRGTVVAAFRKKSGAPRYVVENGAGLLHIFSSEQLTRDV